MTKRQEDICDIVDITSLRLLRVHAAVRAIRLAEDGLDQESVITPASIAEDEAYNAKEELQAWFDGLMNRGKQ
jgi:hypothetical protein